MYRQVFVGNRLSNLDTLGHPIRAEVFLDESYCHVDHAAKKTWVRPRGKINETGRKPMLVTFAAFVVFTYQGFQRATIIEDSVHVWPVAGGEREYIDYHGYFNAEKFESLFENLCKSIQQFGSCIIYMNGASYHKRRTNKVPTSQWKKAEIVE